MSKLAKKIEMNSDDILKASAPDMLAALKQILVYYNDIEKYRLVPVQDIRNLIVAVISKAEFGYRKHVKLNMAMTLEEMEAIENDPDYCGRCEMADCGECHCCQCRED